MTPKPEAVQQGKEMAVAQLGKLPAEEEQVQTGLGSPTEAHERKRKCLPRQLGGPWLRPFEGRLRCASAPRLPG